MNKGSALLVVLIAFVPALSSAQTPEPFASFASRNGIARPERYLVDGGDYFLPVVAGVDAATRTITLGGYLPRTGQVTFRWDDYREFVAEGGAYTPANLSRRFDASLPVRFVVVTWTGNGGEERSRTLYAWLERPNADSRVARRATLAGGAQLVVSDGLAQIVTPDPAGLMRTQSLGGRPVLDVLGDHFPDVFDFVLLAPDPSIPALPTSGFIPRSNDVQGIGLDRFADARHPKVRGVVSLGSSGSYALGWSLVCREMLRAWANYAVDTGMTGSWGFSTAYGKLGGMNGGTLRELGEGRYTVDYFVPGHNSWVPYSPIELYFMGLAPASDVGPLRVFDAARVVDETPESITFSAPSSHLVTIQDVIAAKGRRVPAYPDSQKSFRALAVVVTGTELDLPSLTQTERALAAFALDRPLSYRYEYGELNYAAVTGGRATIRLDGLTSLYRETP